MASSMRAPLIATVIDASVVASPTAFAPPSLACPVPSAALVAAVYPKKSAKSTVVLRIGASAADVDATARSSQTSGLVRRERSNRGAFALAVLISAGGCVLFVRDNPNDYGDHCRFVGDDLTC